ncbi:uncharacterized protein LOC129749099 isoform X2 [Uranotaenia lowii]|uniref:uncharacterized protein LOC129749099 isoform X2 n=1 Tax=Uranotaenia lowii TaxID=190385 RepID=UPI0024792366|nr:uncharacterized protein LOC129749099 isoform X2 [Uranotaenia lowii]
MKVIFAICGVLLLTVAVHATEDQAPVAEVVAKLENLITKVRSKINAEEAPVVKSNQVPDFPHEITARLNKLIRKVSTKTDVEEAPVAKPNQVPVAVPDTIVEKLENFIAEVRAKMDAEPAPIVVQPNNVIDAPVQCPPGQKPDHNNKCRDVWSKNVPAEESS